MEKNDLVKMRDKLLRQKCSENNYSDGVLDMYNEAIKVLAENKRRGE